MRSLREGCCSTVARHYDHFMSLTHRTRTAPECSAPAQQWWDRSTLTFSCQGLYDWFSQSKFRKKPPSKYYLFNIWVLLCQPQESWWILSPLRVRNSLGNDIGSQKLLNCCTETLKKKMQPEAERSHRRFQSKLLALGVFISNCKQESANHSANSTAGSTALGTAASPLQRGRGCNGAVEGGSSSTPLLPALPGCQPPPSDDKANFRSPCV